MRNMLARAGWLAILVLAVVLAGCGKNTGSSQGGRIQVVAAESFWGSIASQLGGSRVSVKSIVSNPATDPHDYEPTAGDGRRFATSRIAVVNGSGYDPWASKLLAASPASGRTVIDVGKLVGVHAGGNPHLWYSPAYVDRVIARISAAYVQADPPHATSFIELRRRFENRSLRDYRRLVAAIRTRYGGTPVGASESIFAYLANALGLRLETPQRFLDAISEGTDPTASDKRTVDAQIASRAIKVWVYNSQNATPDVRRLTAAARRAGIPVVTITETPLPATASFQAWQTRQLEALRAALGRATGQ